MEGEESFAVAVPDTFEKEQEAASVAEGEDGPEQCAEGDDDEAFGEPPTKDGSCGDSESC